MVLWEESARDGAQAKTLMDADFRVRLAREQGRSLAQWRHVEAPSGR